MNRVVDAMRAGHLPTILASAFLLAQVALVVHSLFIDERFFCWAPHTTMVRFTIHTVIDEEELTREQVQKRYGLRWSDRWEAHAAANLFQIVQRHERRARREDHATVWIDYSINGGEPRRWDLERDG